MPNKNDLRYVRSEVAIREAFMELVAERSVGSVTASDVCRRAGISRNAFYLHHASVVELYSTLVGELVEDVRVESIASSERRVATGVDDKFYEAIISSIAKHEELLRALLPSDDGSLTKCLVECIEEAFVEAALRFGEHGGSFEHRLRCAYAAGALVGFASRWLAETDRPLTDGLDSFRELYAGAVEVSAQYLLDAGRA